MAIDNPDALARATDLTNKLMPMAAVHLQQGQTQQFQATCEEALSIAKAVNDFQLVASVLRRAGGICELQGQLQQGLDYYQQALPFVRGTDTEAIVLNRIADFYLRLERFDEAIATYQSTISAFRSSDSEWEAMLLRDIAYCYESQGETELAKQYEQQADAIEP